MNVQSCNYLDRTFHVGDRVRRTSQDHATGVISDIHMREGLIPSFSITFDGSSRPVICFTYWEFEQIA